MLPIEFVFAAAFAALGALAMGCCGLLVFKRRQRRKAEFDAPFSKPSDWGSQ